MGEEGKRLVEEEEEEEEEEGVGINLIKDSGRRRRG